MGPFSKKNLGQRGEAFAISVLQKSGYRILEKNFRTNLGEIDIVAQHEGTICFVEVKTRKTLAQGVPQEPVTPSKMRKLSQVALCYLKEKNLMNKKARFDVVSVIEDQLEGTRAEIIPDAFELYGFYSY